VVELAALEMLCTSKGYRGFESHPFRQSLERKKEKGKSKEFYFYLLPFAFRMASGSAQGLSCESARRGIEQR
jgi:hypothetical protein